MFQLRVARVALLSADGAHSYVRGNEFLRVKGELVDAVIRMQCDMGRTAPAVALWRVPLLLTNKKSLHGDEADAPLFNRVKQHAVLKFDFGPTQAVHVRDVAKAMVADGIMFGKRNEMSDLEFRFRKRQYELVEYWGEDIVKLATVRREAQREAWRRRREARDGRRISEYAKGEGGVRSEWGDGSGSVGGSGADLDEQFTQELSLAELPSRESAGFQELGERYSDDRENGQESDEGADAGEDGGPGPIIGDVKGVPIGSVESLRRQLALQPIKIRENELLPDIEPSEGGLRDSAVDRDPGVPYDTAEWEQEVLEQEREAYEEYGDAGVLVGDAVPGTSGSGEGEGDLPLSEIQLPDYAPGAGEVVGEEDDVPRISNESFDPTQDFPERDSFVSYASYAAGRVPEEEIFSGYRPPPRADGGEAYGAGLEADPRDGRRLRATVRSEGASRRRRRSRKDVGRSQSEVEEPLPPMQRFSALVTRIIAATDRPSQRRRRREGFVTAQEAELDVLDQGFDAYYDPPIRGNGDMREAGNIDI